MNTFKDELVRLNSTCCVCLELAMYSPCLRFYFRPDHNSSAYHLHEHIHLSASLSVSAPFTVRFRCETRRKDLNCILDLHFFPFFVQFRYRIHPSLEPVVNDTTYPPQSFRLQHSIRSYYILSLWQCAFLC